MFAVYFYLCVCVFLDGLVCHCVLKIHFLVGVLFSMQEARSVIFNGIPNPQNCCELWSLFILYKNKETRQDDGNDFRKFRSNEES